MNSADFRKYISKQLKDYLYNKQSKYHAINRQSRPRAKENIINPKMKGI